MNNTFESVTREKVENLNKTVDTGFKLIDKRLNSIENKQVELFNHQSNRLPLWATGIITFLSSLSVGLLIAGFGGLL